MKIICFNANSIRMRTHQLKALIEKHAPDFIGVQETKVTDEQYPIEDIEALGYQSLFYGQKTHYGVALLSRLPFKQTLKGFPGDAEDAQRRFVAAEVDHPEFGNLWLLNGYFPQGENRDHDTKFPAKKKFYEDLQSLLETQHDAKKPVIVMGDINISPEDCDIGIGEDNRKRWLRTGKCSFLPEEREWLQRLKDWGLTDTHRFRNPEGDDKLYSWFDYRSRGFEREPKRGLRIDVIMATDCLNELCVDTGIDYEVRGMEKPSDHAPIWAEFKAKDS